MSSKKITIPADLDGCFAELNKLISPKDLAVMKSGTEKDTPMYHFGLGMWLRNNWGLWNGSKLKTYFENMGIYHADDMSGIILTSFQRHIRGQPLDIETQVKHYQKYWKDLGVDPRIS